MTCPRHHKLCLKRSLMWRDPVGYLCQSRERWHFMTAALVVLAIALAVSLIGNIVFFSGMIEIRNRYDAAELKLNELETKRLPQLTDTASKASELEQELATLKKDHKALKDTHSQTLRETTVVKTKVYKVVLDGLNNSGKSTLVMRWINPLLAEGETSPTAGYAEVGNFQLCSRTETREGRTHRTEYYLSCIDPRGESENKVNQALIKLEPEVAVLVIHPLQEQESLVERFSSSVLSRTYKGLSFLRGMVVLVNFSDLNPEAASTTMQLARKQILETLGDEYEPISASATASDENSKGNKKPIVFLTCSAKRGDNVPQALGHIAAILGVSDHMPKHSSSGGLATVNA